MAVVRNVQTTVSASWPLRGRWPTVTELLAMVPDLEQLDPDQQVVIEPGGMGLNPSEQTVAMVKPYSTEVTATNVPEAPANPRRVARVVKVIVQPAVGNESRHWEPDAEEVANTVSSLVARRLDTGWEIVDVRPDREAVRD
jgi:hypothetical protein